MEELLYKTSFWIARDYELTAYRYVELSQSLMLFSDRTFELRWINYAQNSALMEPENPSEPVPPNTNIHICVSGNVGIVNSNTLELAPSRKFIGSDEVPLDFSPFRCVVNQSVLAVDSPLQQDPRFNKLTLSKAKTVMDSIQELVEMLKDGRLSRTQVLERVANASLGNISRPPSSFTSSRVMMESPNWNHEEFSVDYSDEELPRRPPSITPQTSVAEKAGLNEFFRRQSIWRNAKAEQSERRRALQAAMTVEECTFAPKLLQESSPQGDTMRRLTQVKDYSGYEAVRLERERAKQEAELSECTFQPKINMNQQVGNRFSSRNLSATHARAEKQFHLDCPFKPDIIGVRPKMPVAQEYTKESAFDRLYSKSEFQTPAQSTAPGSVTNSAMSQLEKAEALSEFYDRQQRFLEGKKQKIQKRLKEPEHKPLLCKRSSEIAKSTFEERNQELLRKRKDAAQKEVPSSFKPKISALGKASRQRSVEELCYGDAERRQQKVEELRKLYEDEKARIFQSTFKTFPSAVSVQSNLRLVDDTASYIDRVREAREQREVRAENDRRAREAKELAECTYTPQIIEAPIFVQRAARNRALLRDMKDLYEPEEAQRKLDWR